MITFFRDRFLDIGVKLNPVKCEWFGDPRNYPISKGSFIQDFIQKYRDAKDFKDSPDPGTIKILGANFCPTGELSKEALFQQMRKKIDKSAQRLINFDSPHKLTLLHYCIPSMMSYAIRMHPPETSQPSAEYFDQAVFSIWSEFAEIEEEDWTRKLASLPVREGGCGFTMATPLRHLAYEASHRAAFGKQGPTQKEATERHVRATIVSLDKDPHLRQHREDCRGQNNDSWLTKTVDCNTKELTTLQSAASLRMRLATPHRNLVRNNRTREIVCKGCKTSIPAARFNQHARGCARVPGANCSQAHAIFKKKMSNYSNQIGVHCESKEPDFTITMCPTCKVFVNVPDQKRDPTNQWVKDHCSTSCPCDAKALLAARRMRPDARFITESGPVVVDYSFTGAISSSSCTSMTKSATANVEQRVATKNRNYKSRVEAAQERFLPWVSSSNGTLSASTDQCIDLLHESRSSEHEDLTKTQMEIDIKRMGASVMAGALMNSEIFHGVTHLRQRYLPGDNDWLSLEDEPDLTTATDVDSLPTTEHKDNNSNVEETRPQQPVATTATSRVSSTTAGRPTAH
jgi:hypothetical protein